jgi:hypothetical protein
MGVSRGVVEWLRACGHDAALTEHAGMVLRRLAGRTQP